MPINILRIIVCSERNSKLQTQIGNWWGRASAIQSHWSRPTSAKTKKSTTSKKHQKSAQRDIEKKIAKDESPSGGLEPPTLFVD
ncbi:hypothetical protein BCON_0089g00240 [Botryotinia convoluta]|uniref:Uncharacterized protein n=1 Tax=Botryotinia convoluta TaxID=54673 RepID=A0A4Z1I1U4_9HELO|nr:hypothetical protein BCON_0089g00240 [Botryotinia convoluta]